MGRKTKMHYLDLPPPLYIRIESNHRSTCKSKSTLVIQKRFLSPFLQLNLTNDWRCQPQGKILLFRRHGFWRRNKNGNCYKPWLLCIEKKNDSVYRPIHSGYCAIRFQLTSSCLSLDFLHHYIMITIIIFLVDVTKLGSSVLLASRWRQWCRWES